MNKTEGRFAQHLQILKAAGEISEWWFGDWTFRLADRLRYTPDFVVMRLWEAPNDTWVTDWDLYDVKGRKNKADGTPTYWAEEDAKIKIKMAAKLWPMFNWAITYPLKSGEWAVVPFGKREKE